MNYKIKLSDEDITTCKKLAQERYGSNRSSGVENKKIGKQSDEFVELQGIGGEFAFCRIFGLEPDQTIAPRGTKTDKGDVWLPNGTLVDIKTTHYRTGKLLVPTWKQDSKIQYFGLMVGTFPIFEFKGWIERENILTEDRLLNLGYGLTHYATQEELDKGLLDDALGTNKTTA